MKKFLTVFLFLLMGAVYVFAQTIDKNSYVLIDYPDFAAQFKNAPKGTVKKFKSVAVLYTTDGKESYTFGMPDNSLAFSMHSLRPIEITPSMTKKITIYYTAIKEGSTDKITLDYIDKDSNAAAANERLLASKAPASSIDKSQYKNITIDKYVKQESGNAKVGAIRKYKSQALLKQQFATIYMIVDPKTNVSVTAEITKKNIGAAPNQVVTIYYTATKTSQYYSASKTNEAVDNLVVDEIEIK
ncbi:MAG: hypothetical protein LBC07_06070 [Elusimicrobiota bacterium]|nr:hypothetical protein [Elusimicrobiota bacterium]